MGVVRGYRDADVERRAPEPDKSPARTEFERDRARLLHSAGLRRLAAKTQVLSPDGSDFVRNRLTHSLEVAQVGRELGKALGCNPDVVDTACLAHDIGHPPFGHNGERALDAAASAIGGFEGNAQTLRLLTFLEPKVSWPDGTSAGLNLTRASLDAATKYPWRRGEQPPGRSAGKFGVYESEADVFAWLREGAPAGSRCLEAQVMDLSDDIAYSVHDVEDGVVGGRIELDYLRRGEQRERIVALTREWYDPPVGDDELAAALGRLIKLPYWLREFDGSRASLGALKDMTSQLIGRFCESVEAATRAEHGEGPLTRYAADLSIPDQVIAETTVLKGIAALYVMAPREDEELFTRQRTIVADLVEVFSQRGPLGMEPQFALDLERAASDAERLRIVVDQVASLTDSSARALHASLCG